MRSMRAALVGMRWFATSETLETKDLQSRRINTGFSSSLIPPVSVANVASTYLSGLLKHMVRSKADANDGT